MNARDEVLAHVRDAIREAADEPVEIPRGYRSHGEFGLTTFLDRLHHYDVRTRRVDEGELATAVPSALHERGVGRVVAPAGVPDAWLERMEVLRDEPPLDPHALDSADGVVTTCAVAIAETGTIVLDGGTGMGRRALSLVPDYHLCVVRRDQIVGGLPEAIGALDPVRPLTFVSGPSATVDIELVRVGGVHGPRALEIIIAE